MEVGLSGPSVWNGDVDGAVADARKVEATGASWARINVRLDVWSGPEDATPRGPQRLGYFAAYDRIVDELTTHGVQVYVLINSESVPGGGEPDSDDFVARYTDAAVKIIDHFKDRVRVFEIYNEPNNWRDTKSKRPTIAPYYLAKLWQDIYLRTKFENGRDQDPCSQVTLVSGALLSFDDADDASNYLSQVFAAGRGQLAWDWMHEHVGTYPLDAVGFHLYPGQGGTLSAGGVQSTIAANLGQFENTVDALDPGTQRPVWLTEIGWTTDFVSAEQQAAFTTAAYQAMNADARMRGAFYFTYQDFPDGNYGLLSIDGQPHPMLYSAFTGAAASYRSARNASFVADDVPSTLQPGEVRTVHLQVKNLGALPWSESDQRRLAAAPGCPSAAVQNQLGLQPGPGGGYVHGSDDARLYLDGTTATSQVATVAFQIVAPAATGRYTLGLRMVEDGTAWFGDTFRRTVTVQNGAVGTPGDGQNGVSGGGSNMAGAGAGGCTMGADSVIQLPISVLVGIFALGLTRRRRYETRR
jgi:hypothetical protein